MNNIAVVPVAIPQVDTKSLLSFAALTLGRSITNRIDEERIDPKSLKGYYLILESIKLKDAAPRVSYSFTAKQLSFSFLVAADYETLLDVTKLGIAAVFAEENVFAIYHASLEQWHLTSIEFCRDLRYRKESRFVFNQIIGLLEQAGFMNLWSGFEKQKQKDETFILVTT